MINLIALLILNSFAFEISVPLFSVHTIKPSRNSNESIIKKLDKDGYSVITPGIFIHDKDWTFGYLKNSYNLDSILIAKEYNIYSADNFKADLGVGIYGRENLGKHVANYRKDKLPFIYTDKNIEVMGIGYVSVTYKISDNVKLGFSSAGWVNMFFIRIEF